jgi:D-arabinose 1-dehydrogenase-like Zn-dependent alcohol dehydrogenase
VPDGLHVIEGQWEPKTHVPLPYTLGHENAGWVHEVGFAVSPSSTPRRTPMAANYA